MSLEQTRKEHRREVSNKDDEVDEVRNNAQKKVRGKLHSNQIFPSQVLVSLGKNSKLSKLVKNF